MSATTIARKYFDAALTEAETEGYDADALARAMLSRVVTAFLSVRDVQDVQAELIAAAENADPDGDHVFMRP